ncbi:DNA mismatch repair protein MutS [[Clostridium] polysaccharolyticum]|uniref:DNA mismatch repair protein MutS n=1 Tax=[Clostridium] polysaccharolyticum TaxID=29364 RepID=A0A1I0E311_9FIRM|nr:DNA mismatch repair protein MutS [[Clostridium] polysaccharolyticum]SET39517.1 DNA mismatch repair protein MutS [[Clostridium] polysaccharolyticum]
MTKLTPMMQQYMETKEQYKDCLLFYRLGDFYEMFFEDAITCSKELEITLTGKACGLEERAPMCGIPYHAVDGYLTKLVSKGYKVAICEQVEDPKMAKGIVKREVVRIVTPGTNLSMQSLDESKNNYLMGIVYIDGCYGLSVVDVTTGDYLATEVDSNRKLIDEINKFMPSEIICNDAFFMSGIDIEDLRNRLQIAVSSLDSWYFDEALCERTLKEHFKINTLDGLGLSEFRVATVASGVVLQYLIEMQKTSLEHLTTITPYITSKYMLLDSSTRRNLEIVETLREKQKRGSLLWVLDKTRTAMGARLLRTFIEQPLVDADEIHERLDAVEELSKEMISREEIREYLGPVYDLERLISRISYKSANPRDLIAFQSSLAMLPPVKTIMNSFQTPFLMKINDSLDTLEDVCKLIEDAITEEPPLAVKEGGIIKEGFREDVDKLRKAKTEGKTWLAELENREKEATGIKNLRVKYNKVFGYYLEVTNSYKDLVPDTWTRKQTLTNAERYTTPELKELEDVILGAEEKLYALEYDIFCEIRDGIGAQIRRIQNTAKAIANIDVFASLSTVAQQNSFVKPELNQKGIIDIKKGRHPVVEKMLANDSFVNNDTYLDNGEKRVSIITGPNMAGKSTYMRQTALIVLMAQIGSFVPAEYANIGIVDRIFTRVGASDDLASGQSTFMVEMTEVANILRNATKNSLLILDEIGRGTSTFDGLSIAWAVVEHIANPKILGAKTLFATHYHELTELEGKLDGVNNYCIAVKEQGDDIVFLRKIVAGGADKSYGIQVAKLAGVPKEVLKRANELVIQLSNQDISENARKIADSHVKKEKQEQENTSKEVEGQLSFFTMMKPEKQEKNEIVEEIERLDITQMTPMDAMNVLYQLQKKAKQIK